MLHADVFKVLCEYEHVGWLVYPKTPRGNEAWMGLHDCVLTQACISPENQPNDLVISFWFFVVFFSLSSTGKAYKFNKNEQKALVSFKPWDFHSLFYFHSRLHINT